MRSKRLRRAVMVVAALTTGAMVLASPNFACESYMVESALTALDFCFIFDCNNGVLGGTVDPCAGGVDAAGEPTPGLLVDCPDLDDESP